MPYILSVPDGSFTNKHLNNTYKNNFGGGRGDFSDMKNTINEKIKKMIIIFTKYSASW